MTITQTPDGEPILAFVTRTKIADQIALIKHMRAVTYRSLYFIDWLFIGMLGGPLVAMLIGVTRCGLSAYCHFYDIRFTPILALTVTEAALTGLYLIGRKKVIEWCLRKEISRRPHIDPKDPNLTEAVSYAFYSSGVSVGVAGATSFCGWEHFDRFDEVGERMFLLYKTRAGLAIPARDVPDSAIATLRELMGPLDKRRSKLRAA